MPNRYHSPFPDQRISAGEGPAPGKRGKTPALPPEKPKARFGRKAYRDASRHDAGMPHVKTAVARDY